MATRSLGDVAQIVMGQSPPGETCSNRPIGLPLLNGPTEYGPHHPLPHQYTTDARKRAHPGDILFCVRGSTTGRMNWADRVYAIGRGVAAIRHKKSADLQPFVRAVIEYELPGLLAQATGSTFPNISASQLAAVPWPPISESGQRAIAHILGTLDDKIELNRQMSETLEAMARALFKSWFVDFDPVRAKAEGRDPGLPQPLADLFPKTLVPSELGEIPTGWQVGHLESVLAELEVGSRPKGGVSRYSEGVPSIGAESIAGLGVFDYSKTKFIPRDFFNSMKRGHVQDRDVLLYKDGGRPGQFEPHVTLVGENFPFGTSAINEHVYRIRANEKVGQEFLFFWLSSQGVMEEMRTKGTGVAIPGLNSTQVKSLTTLIPDTRVENAFARITSPMITRILMGCAESRNLARIRDALLPRLISGDLRATTDVSSRRQETMP